MASSENGNSSDSESPCMQKFRLYETRSVYSFTVYSFDLFNFISCDTVICSKLNYAIDSEVPIRQIDTCLKLSNIVYCLEDACMFDTCLKLSKIVYCPEDAFT